MSSPHKPCAHCGAEPMLQTSGPKARNKWARVQCSNYGICGIQTPQITATSENGMEWAKTVAWERWDRRG